jgi:2-polyprenyl-3-methyl-5-hydroxy-6-metoxy-1,4-benzoquinol methylase
MTSPFYAFPGFARKSREHACCVCGTAEASLVGRMNYAGLGEWDVVQCPGCGLASFDPIPGLEVIREGGKRLYLVEQSSHSRRRFLRFFSRSYRRGGHFALHYLRRHGLLGERPRLLEVGAGNGYFSQGVRKIYPQAKVCYLDVMEDLRTYYEDHFECEAIIGEFSAAAFERHARGRNAVNVDAPGQAAVDDGGTDRAAFDLIIARDILEHVRDPLEFLRDARALLEPGGLLFFITPNGRENLWECSQRFKHSGSATLIWQNHFHFYLPETLHRMLESAGFREEVAFKWGLKQWRRGLGHGEMPGLGPQPIPSVRDRTPDAPASVKWKHDVADVTTPWLHNLGPASRVYSAIVDRQRERVDFDAPEGREFFVIARRT